MSYHDESENDNVSRDMFSESDDDLTEAELQRRENLNERDAEINNLNRNTGNIQTVIQNIIYIFSHNIFTPTLLYYSHIYLMSTSYKSCV